jgi:hypothetical protein
MGLNFVIFYGDPNIFYLIFTIYSLKCKQNPRMNKSRKKNHGPQGMPMSVYV